jgi:uncharacterized protein YjbJ (UPF0337 family)
MEAGAKRNVKGAIQRPVEATREKVKDVKEKLPGVR